MNFLSKKDILDEFTIEVEDNLPEAIRKLQALAGPCITRDSNNFMLAFLCNKKGRFRVDDYNSDMYRHEYHRLGLPRRIAYVEGYVTSENGKTIVHGRSVFSHTANTLRVIGLVIEVLSLIVYAVLILCNVISFSFVELLIFAVIIGSTIVTNISTSNNESYNRMSDLEIMKEEVLRRVHAIDRWDD